MSRFKILKDGIKENLKKHENNGEMSIIVYYLEKDFDKITKWYGVLIRFIEEAELVAENYIKNNKNSSKAEVLDRVFIMENNLERLTKIKDELAELDNNLKKIQNYLSHIDNLCRKIPLQD